MENAAAAPTGCYKCGRPGHWSRDCPSSASASASAFAPIPNSESTRPSSSFKTTSTGVAKSTEKPKKAPRTRPKLTPDLILSDDGLGYVLRHFPRSFKFRGHGHEVSDLGNLIGLYSEWHSRLLPYYSFDQFVHKAEQVAATKRVKMCLRELRERVAKGGDPTKLHEPLVHDDSNVEQVPAEAMNSEAPSHHQGDPSSRNNDADDMHDMFHDIHETATESLHCEEVAADTNQVPNNGTTKISEIQITEEQKTRMESNRLKALERAAARARTLQAP